MARTKQTARKSEAPKEEEEGNGQPTYADYLAERGYTPLCCDNSAEDLFTIFCCFMWLYGFLIAFFCLLMKAYISTTDTSAALWLFAACFLFMVLGAIFAIIASMISKIPAPVQDVPEVVREVVLAKLVFEIQGHTNKAPNSEVAQRALTLSDERAEAVKAEIVKNGCNPTGFICKGYGDEVPKDASKPNGNMRVEAHLHSGQNSLPKVMSAIESHHKDFKAGGGFGYLGCPEISFNTQTSTFSHPEVLFEPNSATVTADSKGNVKNLCKVFKELEEHA